MKKIVYRICQMWEALTVKRVDTGLAEEYLTSLELKFFARLDPCDQLHCIRVARALEKKLESRGVEQKELFLKVRTALLHDIGKAGGVSPFIRVLYVFFSQSIRESSLLKLLYRWKLPYYLQYLKLKNHPRRGKKILKIAGSEDVLVRWVEVHHLPADDDFVRILQVLDGEN